MNKTQKILAGILLVQFFLAAVVYWPKKAVSGAGEPLFGALSPQEVTGITIEGADQQQVSLTKSGEGWVLSTAGDYPVDAERVTAFLGNVLGITTGRLVTTTEGSLKQLQVSAEKYAGRITLAQKDGASRLLYVGSTPGAGSTHVRLDGQNSVYLTDKIKTYTLGSKVTDWIDTTLLNVAVKDIVRIRLMNANGQYVFTQGGDSTWAWDGLEEGQTLVETKVLGVVNSTSTLRMVAPVGREVKAEYGLVRPGAELNLEVKESSGAVTLYRLEVGVRSADGSYYAKVSTSDYVVRLSATYAEMLLGLRPADLASAAPTPAENVVTPTP